MHSDGQASLVHTPHTPAAADTRRLEYGVALTWGVQRWLARQIRTFLLKDAEMSSRDSTKVSGQGPVRYVRERCSSLLRSCSHMHRDITARPSLQKLLSGSACNGIELCPALVQPSCHSVDRRLPQKYMMGRLCYFRPAARSSPQRTPVATTPTSTAASSRHVWPGRMVQQVKSEWIGLAGKKMWAATRCPAAWWHLPVESICGCSSSSSDDVQS